MTKLVVGGLKNGFTYVYQLWKSLLNHWFGQEGTRVYMASPFLDTERLTDIVEIFLRHKPRTNLEVFYTQAKSNEKGKKSTAEMKKEVSNIFNPKLGPFIEYHVYRHIMYPRIKFNANFLAGVRDGIARVLVTSASFDGNHFAAENFETVMYIQLSEVEFREKYIKPISVPAVATF